MKCSIHGCPGEYEPHQIVHAIRDAGRLIVIDHVPAEVCSVCGDVLLAPATIRRIETLLSQRGRPDSTAPVFEYGSVA